MLLLILGLSAFLRFWELGTLPSSFHNDEVMNGYIGRFILETGTDIYGNSWPILYFNNFGDYPNVIPMYLSGAFTYIFGINEFAVRFPIALFGLLTVIIVYLVAQWLWKARSVALMSAFLLGIMPWHIVLSRATAEGITASFVLLLGLFLIFKGIDARKSKLIILGWLTMSGTYLLYPGFRVLVPLSLLPGILIIKDSAQKKLFILLTLIFFSLTAYISQTEWGTGRYHQTSIFTHNSVIDGRSINYSTGLGPNRVLEAKIFHNSYALVTREFLRQYSSYFSPAFLFGEGGKPLRYAVPEHGLLYWSLLGTAVLALGVQFIKPLSANQLHLFFKNKRGSYFVWITWILLLAPLPAALTLDDVPNVHRTAVMAPLLALILAGGWYYLSQLTFWKKGMLGFLIILGCFGELAYFWHYYINLYSATSAVYRHSEKKALASWLLANKNNYQTIYISNKESLQIHYLFLQENFSSDLTDKFREGMKINELDNIRLVEADCPSELVTPNPNQLVVDRHECELLVGYQEVGTITFANGLNAYSLRTTDTD
jgi:4-amino-4-deoxy-L-arabinose transferase-like glycosyltransferase